MRSVMEFVAHIIRFGLLKNKLKYCSVYSHCYATTVRWAVIPDQFVGNGSVTENC